MFTNSIKSDWKSDTLIPFNQATGTELRTLYQRDLKKLQTEQLEVKKEITKTTEDLATIERVLVQKKQEITRQNQSQIKKNLQKEINALNQRKKEIVNGLENTKETLEQLKEEISDLKGALERLNTDLKIDAELETNGYFGSSRLGQCMSAVVQIAALPLTTMLEVATRHPFLVGGMIIANQMFSTAAATLTTTQTDTNATSSLSTSEASPHDETSLNFESIDGVKNITHCLNDYHKLNNNETITHKLVNTCKNSTMVEGYVDLKCSVNPPHDNRVNAFELEKHGDFYTVETKNTESCQQPILISKPPQKISNCLYSFDTKTNTTLDSDLVLKSITHKLINGCHGKVNGYIKIPCFPAGADKGNSWNQFTIENQGDTFTTATLDLPRCHRAIYEGVPPTTKIDRCLLDFQTRNENNTITHRMVHQCHGNTYGFVKKGCSVHLSDPNDPLNKFIIRGKKEHTIVTYDKKGCEKPIFKSYAYSTNNFEKQYCSFNNTSLNDLPGTPKAAKIVAGDKLPSDDARHLAFIANRELGGCSGSLVGDRFVLTAAHCLKNTENELSRPSYVNNIKVKHDPNPQKGAQSIPTTEYKVISGHILPCYYTAQSNCDLALLTLEKPIVNGKYVSLSTDSDFCEFARAIDKVRETDITFPHSLSYQYDRTLPLWEKGNAIIQGFGKEKNAQGKLVNSQTAQYGNAVAWFIENNDGSIATTPPNRGTDTSFGDSGGPLIFETKQGKKVQMGVDCCGSKSGNLDITYYANLNNKAHRRWLEESINEYSTFTKIPSGDLTHLRFSPDSCVEQLDQPDDFLSWLTSFLSSEQGRRKLTFTNLCYDKNHPSKVNIKFYSSYSENGKSKEKLETIHGIESATQVVAFAPGETRVFHTNGTPVKTLLSWSDIDAKIGIRQDTSKDYT